MNLGNLLALFLCHFGKYVVEIYLKKDYVIACYPTLE